MWCSVSSVDGRQTVPRAELTGTLLLLAAGHHEVFSDSLYVVRGSEALASDQEGTQSSYLGSVNCDLWHRFLPWRATATVGKVKAHTSLKEVADGFIEFDIFSGMRSPTFLLAMQHICLHFLTLPCSSLLQTLR